MGLFGSKDTAGQELEKALQLLRSNIEGVHPVNSRRLLGLSAPLDRSGAQLDLGNRHSVWDSSPLQGAQVGAQVDVRRNGPQDHRQRAREDPLRGVDRPDGRSCLGPIEAAAEALQSPAFPAHKPDPADQPRN